LVLGIPYFYSNKLFVLSSIKKLATQTVWYGASTIFSRMLGYLLTPLLTSIFVASDFGKITTLFTLAAFMNILYSFGMETAYFRFLSEEKENKVYNAAFTTILVSGCFFSLLLFGLTDAVAAYIKLSDHTEYIYWVIWIVIFDTLAVLPFAKLRYSGRPKKYAFIKIINIIIQIGLVIFFLIICKNAEKGSWLSSLYDHQTGVGYVILANVFSSALTLLLLSAELFKYRWSFGKEFFRKMIIYALPLLIVGFGGMVNELIDRFMILQLYPGTVVEKYTQSGIYSANFKLAIVIVLFIQAFRLGAEPFFFKQSIQVNAPIIYARVMKYFVITCCICFLMVVLFLDFWKYFMGNRHTEYWNGLHVVPILMLAKIFLGIYYNLSVWYKLTNKNLTGAWITLGGVVITVAINFLMIPSWGYTACAVATLCCYGFMMVASYLLGQKHYPVPYDIKIIGTYILVAVLIFGLHFYLSQFVTSLIVRFVTGALFSLSYLIVVFNIDRKEFIQLPVIRKWFAH
jgi:O-antigen/teichoic acid export membrane protein